MNFVANTVEELPNIAKQIVDKIQHKCVIFVAEMGAGKTTLIKAMLLALGSKDNVSSPTFSIVNQYVMPNHQKVYHFDLYRFSSIEEVLDVGFDDYLNSNALVFIEWPQIAQEFLPEKYHTIHIDYNQNQRTIYFDSQ